MARQTDEEQVTKSVSKIAVNGRITLSQEIMDALGVREGDFVQLIVNSKGPEVKIQKVMPYEI